ncbi:hypothetical protein ACJ73_07554 [Blastomyces percursus]|uniref:Uncharacterized protein n=1 Tax=Blastomyces percursus TaxID=1658174 RepID=A0A1J9QLL0_9EURO|nr:hypothetical protein ACJ73_07554 [Blastomyces percursus]
MFHAFFRTPVHGTIAQENRDGAVTMLGQPSVEVGRPPGCEQQLQAYSPESAPMALHARTVTGGDLIMLDQPSPSVVATTVDDTVDLIMTDQPLAPAGQPDSNQQNATYMIYCWNENETHKFGADFTREFHEFLSKRREYWFAVIMTPYAPKSIKATKVLKHLPRRTVYCGESLDDWRDFRDAHEL